MHFKATERFIGKKEILLKPVLDRVEGTTKAVTDGRSFKKAITEVNELVVLDIIPYRFQVDVMCLFLIELFVTFPGNAGELQRIRSTTINTTEPGNLKAVPYHYSHAS